MKTLVVVTVVFLVGLSAFVWYENRVSLPPPISLKVDTQPTIGYKKAPIHLVVFEEPKCPECRDFSLHVYPKLKTEFLDTNLMRYTVIPVSFIPGSMPAAIALLAAMNQDVEFQNEELFFHFLHYMYQHQPDEATDWATVQTLKTFAKGTSAAIDLDRLQEALAKETYRGQIEKNTDYGMEVMQGELVTPTAYVNGIRAEDLNYSSISHLIRAVLQQGGKR